MTDPTRTSPEDQPASSSTDGSDSSIPAGVADTGIHTDTGTVAGADPGTVAETAAPDDGTTAALPLPPLDSPTLSLSKVGDPTEVPVLSAAAPDIRPAEPAPDLPAADRAAQPRTPRRPLFGTIFWGTLMLAFAGFMVYRTLLPGNPDPALWLLGGVIVMGLVLVVAGIAAAARRAP